MESGAECLGIRFKKMDKKLEKQRVSELKASLIERLKEEKDPKEVLNEALPLLFAKVMKPLELTKSYLLHSA